MRAGPACAVAVAAPGRDRRPRPGAERRAAGRSGRARGTARLQLGRDHARRLGPPRSGGETGAHRRSPSRPGAGPGPPAAEPARRPASKSDAVARCDARPPRSRARKPAAGRSSAGASGRLSPTWRDGHASIWRRRAKTGTGCRSGHWRRSCRRRCWRRTCGASPAPASIRLRACAPLQSAWRRYGCSDARPLDATDPPSSQVTRRRAARPC